MTGERRLARMLAFQVLFELESRQGTALPEVLEQRIEDLENETGQRVGDRVRAFARQLVHGALAQRDAIDDRIARAAPAFPVSQLPATDRVALEIAAFELLAPDNAPVKVVINEAVEMAKTYGGENSGRFVNGVLGTIAEEITKQPRDITPEPQPSDPASTHTNIDTRRR